MIPPCHNRAPMADGRWHDTGRKVQDGTRESPAHPIVWGQVKRVIRWRWRWYEDRCATWLGTGIGQPTVEYPTGMPYPLAHGWDCSGCRWKP